MADGHDGVRVAAVGDVHAGADDESVRRLRSGLANLGDHADVLLLAGDLTRCGDPGEAAVVAGAVAASGLPSVAVLGNHDLHADRGDEVVAILEDAGTTVLEGGTTGIDVRGLRIGLNGIYTPDYNVYIFEGTPYKAGASFPLHTYLLYDRRILQKYQTTFRLGLNNITDIVNGDSAYRITGATSFNATARSHNALPLHSRSFGLSE